MGFASSEGPVDYWRTIDDVTGKPKAIIEIWRDQNKNLYGKILKIFPQPGLDKIEFCTACLGKKHNQPLIGLVILEKLKQSRENKALWSNGTILDPKTGKEYNSNLQLSGNGNKLNVRGYIGVPLFGRTQTWHRINGFHNLS